MRFVELALRGAVLVQAEPHRDERGWFARTFAEDEFRAHGLNPAVVQTSVSFNARRGTLRGMHLQVEADAEEKLVRCARGRIFDVLVDLRPDSPSYCAWAAVELTAGVPDSLYVPKGVAHGFMTLEDDTEVHYQMSQPYNPSAARGVRWDDPRFGIEWPCPVRVISERDRTYPDYTGSFA